jgi:hypothetical protein
MGRGKRWLPAAGETRAQVGHIFLTNDFSCFTSEAYRLHYARLFFSSIHDPNLTHTIPWRRRINEQTEVYQPGLGYPVSDVAHACGRLQKESTCGAASTTTATTAGFRANCNSFGESEHN